MSVHSSGFSILPQMGYVVKGYRQLVYYSLTVGATDRGSHKCGPHRDAMNGAGLSGKGLKNIMIKWVARFIS